jgi:lauroyl/myristoyl acyltransferase
MQREFHKAELWRRAAAFGVQKGPDWFVRYAPTWIGWFMAVVLGSARRAVRANLRLIFGRRSLGRELADVFRTFASFAHSLVEGMQAEQSARPVEVHGADELRALLSSGRGLVLVTAHAGPYDRAAQLISTDLGARVMLLMGHEEDERAAAFQDQIRRDFQVRVLRLGRHPLDALPALEHLAAGGIVAAQIDRVPELQEAIRGELFGRDFLVPRGPFVLAGLAGVPLAAVFVGRREDGSYETIAGQPLVIPRRPSEEELVRDASLVLGGFEDYLRRFPTQWYNFARRPQETSSEERERRGAGENHLAKGAP